MSEAANGESAGSQAEAAGVIKAEQLDDWLTLGGVQVIDVREPDERQAGHIPGTQHIPLNELADQAAQTEPASLPFNKDRQVVFYCATGNRSGFVAEAARASGYNALSLVGGFVTWCEEGRPFTPGEPVI